MIAWWSHGDIKLEASKGVELSRKSMLQPIQLFLRLTPLHSMYSISEFIFRYANSYMMLVDQIQWISLWLFIVWTVFHMHHCEPEEGLWPKDVPHHKNTAGSTPNTSTSCTRKGKYRPATPSTPPPPSRSGSWDIVEFREKAAINASAAAADCTVLEQHRGTHVL